MTQYDELITDILEREGWDKFTDHPADKGGPTKWGITQESWGGDVRNITEEEARAFYLDRYIIKPRFNEIWDDYLQELVIDCGVNHGTGRAARWLQDAAGVAVDGKIGPLTLEAVNEQNPEVLFLGLIVTRTKFYADIVRNNTSQVVFLRGWINRSMGFLEQFTRRLDATRSGG